MAVVVLVEEKNKRRDLKDFELIKARSECFKEHLIQIWGFRIRYVIEQLELHLHFVDFSGRKEENLKLKRLKDELREPLCWTDYLSLPFTQTVITETLRMGNVIVGVTTRKTGYW